MNHLRWLLFPFSMIYGLVVITRNWLYDAGLFKSYRFNVPVISVGNLEVGGAGKSPMTEYLIRLFIKDYKLAVLSRGYGRKTQGYLVAGVGGKEQEIKSQEAGQDNDTHSNNRGTSTSQSIASQIGDEPAQFKNKFPDITVAVCEYRVTGIKNLLADHDLIVMDDAFQHRAVKPGFSILLFDYNGINRPRLLLPAGDMREPISGRWRAQVLIVSKCPPMLSVIQKAEIAATIKPLPYQQLFFSCIAYQALQNLDGNSANVAIDEDTTVFLLTGIANSKPLVQYLNGFTSHIIHHKYPDHHPFTLKNISKLADGFLNCTSSKKLIITTEKDAQRLMGALLKTGMQFNKSLPVYVLPIRVEFLNDSAQQFNKVITEYVREYTTDNRIY